MKNSEQDASLHCRPLPISAAVALALVLSLQLAPANSATLSVPEQYATIQAAIDDAVSGDLVEVDIGTYTENLTLKSEVDVLSIEAARTFLVPSDSAQPAVLGIDVTDLLFSGFTFIDATAGIRLQVSSGIIIASNIFAELDGNAVFADIDSDVEIINNVFWRNSVAIDRRAQDVAITNNIFAENTATIVTGGLSPVDPDENVLTNCFDANSDLGNSGLGTDSQQGNAGFVDTVQRDFHLRQSSACIDLGTGTDVIDATVADMGAYGGEYADGIPYPVATPTVTDASTGNPPIYNINISWPANLAYLVSGDPAGSYNIGYQLNQPGPPYDAGADAGNGTLPSPINVSANLTEYLIPDLQPTATPPGAPVLQSAAPQNQSVRLTWAAATGAESYAVHYGEAAVTENTIDVGNTLSYTVTGLQNATDYVFAVSANAQPVYYLAVAALDRTQNPAPNESDYSTEVSIAIGEPVAGPLSNELQASPEAVEPYPTLPNEGCFVATAAYGADWKAEVRVLRDFRDRYLLTNAPGRSFVAWYYRDGPRAAALLNAHPEWKPLARLLLWPLVALAAFLLGASLLTKITVVVLVTVSLLYWQLRRRIVLLTGCRQ